MPIAAQRFQFLDNQTNVPIADLASQTASDLLNMASNDLKTITQPLSDLISSNNPLAPIENIGSTVQSTLSNALNSLGVSRITKDSISSALDLSSATQAAISNAVSALAGGNGSLLTSLKQFGSGCTNAMLSGINTNNLALPTTSCGNNLSNDSGNSACNLTNLASAISGATGSPFSLNLLNPASLENVLSALGNMGFKSGLCSLFSNLVNGLTSTSSITNIASNLLGNAVSNSNMLAVVDVGLGLGSATGNVTSNIPGISSMIFSNYSQPNNVTSAGLSSFYNTFTTATSNIDSNWDTSDAGGLSSINLGGSTTSSASDINNLFMSDSSTTAVSPSTDGSVVSMPDSSYLYTANQYPQSDPLADLVMSNPIIGI